MKIMLDAGHYAKYNKSPHSSKYYESQQMWKLTNYQKQYLEEYKGVTVSLTRTNIDKDLAVYNRGNLAKGYDLFISNHTNASDSYSTDYPVVIGAYDISNNKLGKDLAVIIEKTMKTSQSGRVWTKKNSNGGEYYGVLRGARAAGVKNKLYYILEHSFHTNKDATTWLLSDSNLKSLAKAEVEVIAKHFGLSKKSSTTTTNTTCSEVYKIITDSLNVRKGPGTSYDVVTTVKKGEAYTIVEKSSNNWGKLKSGIGWISLNSQYVAKK